MIMPVPDYIPARVPVPPGEWDTTDIQPDTQDLTFSQFGTKGGYYQFIGEQDGMEGVGPNPVQRGDEEFQRNYDEGWRSGTYFRSMAGVNGFNI